MYSSGAGEAPAFADKFEDRRRFSKLAPMQRQRLTPNVHVGLALGIATASVILALGGCAITPIQSTQSAETAPPTASLEQFSEDEQARILAVQEIVAEAAAQHQLDPALLNGMIWVESRFDPKAKSPAGARGLMQLMPSTAAYLAKRMGEQSARAYDPEFNVHAGALYLAEMKQKFGDEQLAVAAYHAGPGNVKKWVEAGQPMPDYSEAYVAKVMEARARFAGVDMHGRHSGQRAKPVAQPESKPTPVVDPVDELVPPDLATLPSAAEIHGVEPEIHERSKPEPQPEPEPSFEPVFEVHRELDRNPAKPPPGWNIPPRSEPQAKPKPKPRPKPAPEPRPESPASPESEQPVGLGVLPDV